MAAIVYGEQNPTGSASAISWQTWSNGSGSVPTILGDADWGKLQLGLDPTDEGRSAVVDLGSIVARTFKLTENVYGSGTGTATLQIRGNTGTFSQDDASPDWETYFIPIQRTWRYMQIREAVEIAILPQNLLLATGTFVESFETIGDWTASEGSIADDSTNYIDGSHSVASTSATGSSGKFYRTISQDMSSFGRGYVHFRMTASLGDYPSVYFYSNSAMSKYIRYKSKLHPLGISKWEIIHFHQLGMLDDGTAPDTSAIIRFLCRHVAPAGQTRVASFDKLCLGVDGIPAIFFQFEDGRDEHYDCATYMTAHNIRGNFSIVSDNVGDVGRVTWAQLREMETNGHCIINATKDHTSLGTLSEAAQEAELTDCRDALIANGLCIGWAANNWKYMSFPNGSYNSNSFIAFDNVGMRMGFNTVSEDGLFGMPFAQVYMLPMKHLTIDDTLETITGFIDDAIARGQLLMFYLEDLGGTSITYDTFCDVIDYIVTKKDQIYSVNYQDLYQLQTGSTSVLKIK